MVYSHFGSGEVIVLIHGFLEERGMWSHFAAELSETNRVVCVDLLGQGESSCLGYIHSMRVQAEAVAAVLKQEGINEFQVVGHSMGGYVALELAKINPDKVRGLVLFHSTALPDSEERKLDRERVIKLAQRNKEVYIKAVIPTLFADSLQGKFSEKISDLARTANEFPTQGIIANIKGMKDRPSYADLLSKTEFPKLVIHGELDNVISTKDILFQVQNATNTAVEFLPEIGHMGHIEAPEKCLKIIKSFCGNN